MMITWIRRVSTGWAKLGGILINCQIGNELCMVWNEMKMAVNSNNCLGVS